MSGAIAFPGSSELPSRDKELVMAVELGRRLHTAGRARDSAILVRHAWIQILRPTFGQRAFLAAVALSQLLHWFELIDPNKPGVWRTKFFDEQGMPVSLLSCKSIAETLCVHETTIWRVWKQLEADGLIICGKVSTGDKRHACVRPNFSNMVTFLETNAALPPQ